MNTELISSEQMQIVLLEKYLELTKTAQGDYVRGQLNALAFALGVAGFKGELPSR